MEKQNEENFKFVWIIKNFSMSLHFKKEYFCSPLFELNTFPGMKWCIYLYPLGYSDKNYVSISLRREDDLPEDCKLHFGVQFQDCNEKKILTKLSKTKVPQEYEKKFAWGYEKFIERDLLLRSLIRDILVIKYILKPLSESNDQDILPAVPYNDGLFTDVLLRARGVEFKVHKAMLRTRWPELAEKLDEQNISEQDFDIESNVLETMIRYIYTGKLGYVFNFEEVYVTAARYGLRILGPIPGSIKTCKTRFNTEKITFVWTVKNFSSLPVNTELYQEIETDASEFSKWSLRVHICEKTETDQVFDIYICKTPEQEFKPLFLKTKVSFGKANSSENEHLFEKEENWKCAEFSRNISSDPNDILLLRCEFILSTGSFSSRFVESSCFFATSVGDTNFDTNLRNLYEKGTLSDVTIIAGSRRFPVHKFILASQSSVFYMMFEKKKKKPVINEVEISDVDPDILHKMLLYLYTGDVETLCEEIATQLYTVADKYAVSSLKSVCSSFLKSSITVENVCKILQLAHAHYDDDLYQGALEYFADHLQEIYSTDEWKEMPDKNFCEKLQQDVAARNKFPI